MTGSSETEGTSPPTSGDVVPTWLVGVAWVALGTLVLGLVIRAVASQGFYWADDYAHLQISRLALRDPRWILDVWGRPLMTIAYMPAVSFGDGAVRATSLVLLGLTALACARIARAKGLILAPAAALMLLAQPLTARIGFSALPYTVFSLLLAIALLLRARGRAGAVAVASLLPLARLEGIFVLVVWAVVLLRERRARLVPLLAVGVATWAAVGALMSGDWLWLWHNNPYGLLGSRYGAAGWQYVFHAYWRTVGPIVGGLALTTLACPWATTDPLIYLLAFGLPVFYAVAWELPAFQTLGDPVYLVTASVPFALVAHASLVRLVSVGAARRLRGAAGIAAGVLIAAAVVIGLDRTKPLPLDLPALLSKRLADSLGERAAEVAVWSDPAFGWYARRLPEVGWGSLPDLPSGSFVAWDSKFAPHQWATSEADMRTLGFDPVWETREAWASVILWRRR
jgi:hypothetical protein